MNRPLPLAAALLLAALGGCGGPKSAPTASAGAQHAAWRDELFTYAIDNLNRLEEFEPGSMLQQIVERLNQWIAHQPKAPWQLDPLAAELPERLRTLPAMAALDRAEFSPADGALLQEAVWLRDVSNWARGGALDELARTRRLFDWTVRNIQLDAEAPARLPYLPWQTLLFGHGTAWERAWVFIGLLQQQGIDAAVLADDRPWAVGARIGDEVYLFDTALGLPLPAGEPKRSAKGELEIVPATLRQWKADPAIRRRLSTSARAYGPADSARLVAHVAASPLALSRRAVAVERRLAGNQRVALAIRPAEVAVRWKKAGLDARLWQHPLETVARQQAASPEEGRRSFLLRMLPFQIDRGRLWKARLLHLKGRWVGDDAATGLYQASRPADADIAAAEEARAAQYLRRERQQNPQGVQKLQEDRSAGQARFEASISQQAKQHASYWLGLVAYERENYAAAIDYFDRRTLRAVVGNGPWTAGARYNLGRSYEAAGRPGEAADQYRQAGDAADTAGQALRAGWIAGQGSP